MSKSLKNQVTKKVMFKVEQNVCRCLGEEVPVRQYTSFSNNFRTLPEHYYNEVWKEIMANIAYRPRIDAFNVLCGELKKQILQRIKR